MTVAIMLVLGAGFGLGLWALLVWLVPPRPSLAALLAGLDATPTEPPPSGTATSAATDGGGGGWVVRLGRPFVGVQRALGLPGEALAEDLAIIGRPVPAHLAEKATAALVGLFLPAAMELAFTLGGRPLPWALPAVGAVALAVAGFLFPDAVVRAEAARRRAAFRHALSAYLNLVHILLAGGAGVEGALTDAASVGQGWPFALLRRALATARATRATPWAALAELGDELRLAELGELAAAVSLAGTEGAKVRASLAAKAAALRARAGTDAEAKANAATERMAIPGVLLAVGFIVFVFYPAMTQITRSL